MCRWFDSAPGHHLKLKKNPCVRAGVFAFVGLKLARKYLTHGLQVGNVLLTVRNPESLATEALIQQVGWLQIETDSRLKIIQN